MRREGAGFEVLARTTSWTKGGEILNRRRVMLET